VILILMRMIIQSNYIFFMFSVRSLQIHKRLLLRPGPGPDQPWTDPPEPGPLRSRSGSTISVALL